MLIDIFLFLNVNYMDYINIISLALIALIGAERILDNYFKFNFKPLTDNIIPTTKTIINEVKQIPFTDIIQNIEKKAIDIEMGK